MCEKIEITTRRMILFCLTLERQAMSWEKLQQERSVSSKKKLQAYLKTQCHFSQPIYASFHDRELSGSKF